MCVIPRTGDAREGIQLTRSGRFMAGQNGYRSAQTLWTSEIQKPFLWTEALNPYDWENPCGMEDVWCDEDVDEGERRQVILRVPGALYICHYGCAIRFFLIVKGKCVGEVWRDSQTDDRGIMPECSADGRHLGFLDWYEKWLDEGIAAQRTSRITA